MLEFILFVTRVTFFWLLLILLSDGSSFGPYNLVRKLKGCSTSKFVFVTRNICDNFYGLCRDYDLLLMKIEYMRFLN